MSIEASSHGMPKGPVLAVHSIAGKPQRTSLCVRHDLCLPYSQRPVITIGIILIDCKLELVTLRTLESEAMLRAKAGRRGERARPASKQPRGRRRAGPGRGLCVCACVLRCASCVNDAQAHQGRGGVGFTLALDRKPWPSGRSMGARVRCVPSGRGTAFAGVKNGRALRLRGSAWR